MVFMPVSTSHQWYKNEDYPLHPQYPWVLSIFLIFANMLEIIYFLICMILNIFLYIYLLHMFPLLEIDITYFFTQFLLLSFSS